MTNGKYGEIEKTYLGLSGITKDPAARSAPITHCMKRGTRQDMSLSMKEQK